MLSVDILKIRIRQLAYVDPAPLFLSLSTAFVGEHTLNENDSTINCHVMINCKTNLKKNPLRVTHTF